jgi:hypothetical protein
MPAASAAEVRFLYPSLSILKIVDLIDQSNSFTTRMTDPVPENVIAALKGMLGKKIQTNSPPLRPTYFFGTSPPNRL